VRLCPKVKDGIFNEHIEGEGLAGMRACTYKMLRCMSPEVGTNRTSSDIRYPVANGGKADMAFARADFRFWIQPGQVPTA
jgi:hypothetical protein